MRNFPSLSRNSLACSAMSCVLPTVASILFMVAGSTSDALAQPAAGTVRVTVPKANVRLEPAAGSPVLTSVPAGTLLELLEEGEWHLVTIPTSQHQLPRTGYIFSRLVEVTRRPMPAPPSQLVLEPTATAAPPAAVQQQAAPPRAAEADRGSEGVVFAAAPPAPAAAVARLSAREQWISDVEAARKKRDRGLYILIGGIGGGAVIAMAAGSKLSMGGAVLGAAVVMGGGGYGGWTYFRARNRLEDLDRDGRVHGYVSVVPMPGGAYASASFSF